MLRQSCQDVSQPGAWVDIIQLAGLDQRVQRGRPMAAHIRSGFMMLFHFLASAIGIEAERGSDGAQAPFPLT
jgi:hypothetical protein